MTEDEHCTECKEKGTAELAQEQAGGERLLLLPGASKR